MQKALFRVEAIEADKASLLTLILIAEMYMSEMKLSREKFDIFLEHRILNRENSITLPVIEDRPI